MQVTIIGNLTDDPELRFTPSGRAVANFTVAENRRRFNRDRNEWEDVGTTYVQCALWQEAAENVAESLTKGMRVITTGEVYTETYEKRDGGTGISVRMNVSEVGPSIRYATAKVTRNQRRDGGGGQGGYSGQQRPTQDRPADPWQTPPSAPANDPWATPPTEAPPF
ncbi:single-stranded DNA-binding protein [Nocardioides sp.]|uniref:single-stranded DNA-binding protein n=1 Tax=Nocardioides sp. TaxID=35761 RepID=UPI0039E38159